MDEVSSTTRSTSGFTMCKFNLHTIVGIKYKVYYACVFLLTPLYCIMAASLVADLYDSSHLRPTVC